MIRKADADGVINAFVKNEQVKRVFWTLFVATAGLVLARVVDPVTAQQVVGIIAGMGGVRGDPRGGNQIFFNMEIFFK